jgi:hypothetical protein
MQLLYNRALSGVKEDVRLRVPADGGYFLLVPERDPGSQLSTSYIQKAVSGCAIFILQNIICLYATGLQKTVANSFKNIPRQQCRTEQKYAEH